MEEAEEGLSRPASTIPVVYNPTEFIQAVGRRGGSRRCSRRCCLVVIVVILFLQTWRAAIIPLVAIPVSLIGCVRRDGALVGISFNTLSLFGLVLAIGIVVDDAIVVVENVERYMTEGMSPTEAAHKTMDEVGGALIAIALVLMRGVPADGLHHRPAGHVLPAVRHHHRRRHGDLRLRVADAVAGARGAAARSRASTKRRARCSIGWRAPVALVLRRLQLGLRAAVARLRHG